jgi:hypothetical protein
MHTIDNKKAELMGKGNMGVRGISKFLATHQCNAICRYARERKKRRKKRRERERECVGL